MFVKSKKYISIYWLHQIEVKRKEEKRGVFVGVLAEIEAILNEIFYIEFSSVNFQLNFIKPIILYSCDFFKFVPAHQIL